MRNINNTYSAITALFILTSVILAVWTGFGGSPYDPVVALAAMNAVILAVYTYFTRRALDVPRQLAEQQIAREDARRAAERASAATAILAELARIWGRLQGITEPRGWENPSVFISTPILDDSAARIDLFDPKIIQEISSLRVLVADVRVTLDATHEKRSRAHSIAEEKERLRGGRIFGIPVEEHLRLSELESDMKMAFAATDELGKAAGVRAIWALQTIEALVPLLTADGGLLPTEMAEKEVPTNNPPALPQSPFR